MTSAAMSWRQRLRDVANRAGLPRFWRWWMSELAPLLPGASRAAFQRRFARPVVQLSDDEAVFWRPEIASGAARLIAGETVSLAGEPAAVVAAGRAAIARLAANTSAGIAVPKVIVALGPRQVLRKELTLPAALEENLVQALAYDLDRHTPFRPEQLYFDATVVGRDATRNTLRVDWAAALRTVVDGATRRVEEWGAIPIAVVPGPPTTSPTRLNLVPNGARPRQLHWRRWQVWVPIALLASLVAAAVFVPLVQKREYAIALTALTAEAAQQAGVADKLRQQLERMQSDYNFILAKKYAYPSAVRVLDEVTKVLPDDTWLTQFEVKSGGRGKETQRDIYLRGESVNAGRLIALLEDSKLVEGVTPRSPTTKIQGSSGEIFDLGARLRALPAPQPIALTPDMPAPIAAPGAPRVPAAPAAPQATVNAASAPAPIPQKAAAPAAPVTTPQPPAATAAEVVPPAAGMSGFGPFPGGAQPAIPSRGGRAARAAQPSAAQAPAPQAPAAQAPAPVRPAA
ncbi:MAG TPA: PilN domain-containing protein, partial [Casimicrobiaceae bacterium]|nr:PilN domain-containing protein [Casimicrobiaceae bacterium]